MTLTRRLMMAGFVGACAPIRSRFTAPAATSASASRSPAANRAVPRPGNADVAAPERASVEEPGFDAWIRAFRGRASAKGISGPVLDRALRGASYLPHVVASANKQPEFTRSLEDNIALAASDERIRVGKKKLAQHRTLFTKIERKYRVEREVVCAIWGHESTFGARRGKIEVVSALASLSYGGVRSDFFESQLVAALKILQAGDVSVENLRGSWAGAMGHTQFIPTSYLAHAVDFDGDGRRDIWSDDPGDALASAAAYLKNSGWRFGEPWGVEVDPAGRQMNGRPAPNLPGSQLLQPLGDPGPRFLVFNNYKVLRRYNNAMAYAIGVGHLADRLAGGPPFKGPFPRDGEGLTLADRKEIQRRLERLGFDLGTIDGVIGDKTIAAIQTFQRDRGLRVDGVANKALLVALR